jgi:hypothetical protein
MSPEQIGSLSSLPPLVSSDQGALSQMTYPAKLEPKRVSPARVAAASHSSPALSSNPNESVPNSQETHISSSSKGSVIPRLPSDSSSLSNASLPSTESTSPHSLHHKSFSQTVNGAQRFQRPVTPEAHNASKSGFDGAHSSSTSPISVDSPHLKHGSKRTASGAVKLTPNAPATSGPRYYYHQPDPSSLGRAKNPNRIAEVRHLPTLADQH